MGTPERAQIAVGFALITAPCWQVRRYLKDWKVSYESGKSRKKTQSTKKIPKPFSSTILWNVLI